MFSVTDGVHGCRLGDSTSRTSIPFYHCLTVVALGEVPVMTTTDQVNIANAVVATATVGFVGGGTRALLVRYIAGRRL